VVDWGRMVQERISGGLHHLVQDKIQWGLHSLEDPVCGLQSYASGRIQWWTAFIWFRIGSTGGQLGSL
jgi:hypothetical protein